MATKTDDQQQQQRVPTPPTTRRQEQDFAEQQGDPVEHFRAAIRVAQSALRDVEDALLDDL